MSSQSLFQWFDAHVDAQDAFVTPDFNLGQFFYSTETTRALVDRLDRFEHICCLCTPRLASEWHSRGREVRLLDYDERFAVLPGFRRYDLMRPVPVAETFDVVIFDPIFLPGQVLRRAVDMVVGREGAGTTALYMTFPADREAEVLGAFADYGLDRLEFALRYNNVKRDKTDLFALYSNRPLGEING